MTDTPIACAARNVSHSYGKRSALRDVSFDLRPAALVGLVGANGSGKSTLLRILAGVQRPSSGDILQFGENLGSREGAGHGVGAAIDGMALWPSWTVERNIQYVADLAGRPRTEVARALDTVDIAREARTRLRKLSLGNRQRVLLAAAIVAGPRLVLLDEPMNGLDPESRQRVRDVIVRLVGEGRTVIMSSHDLHDVESVCHDLMILSEGVLTYDGPTAGYAQGARRAVFHVASTDAERALLVLAGGGLSSSRDGSGDPVVAERDAVAAEQMLIGAGIAVTGSAVRDATLEEKFHDRV